MFLPWFLSEIGPAAMLNEQRQASVLNRGPASSGLCAGGGSDKIIKENRRKEKKRIK